MKYELEKGAWIRCNSTEEKNPYTKLLECEIRRHPTRIYMDPSIAFTSRPLGLIALSGSYFNNGLMDFGSLGHDDFNFNYHNSLDDEKVVCKKMHDPIRNYDTLSCE